MEKSINDSPLCEFLDIATTLNKDSICRILHFLQGCENHKADRQQILRETETSDSILSQDLKRLDQLNLISIYRENHQQFKIIQLNVHSLERWQNTVDYVVNLKRKGNDKT